MMLLLLACAGGGGDDSTTDGAGETGTSAVDPTLSNVQDRVFTPSCAFSTCHAAPGASDLVLDDGAAWAELVTAPAEGDPDAILVIPGDAEASYLVAKLRGTSGIAGDPMPVGAPLDDTLVQLVVDWIDAGAADD